MFGSGAGTAGLPPAGLSVPQAPLMPQGGGARQEETSYLTMGCSSWFIYHTEKFILTFRSFC